jgi:superfamily II DNA or RNA helicase
MSSPKPFQIATAKAAIRTLLHSKSRRFLIADEVGLGKTVIAQEIIRQMIARKKGGSCRLLCLQQSIHCQSKSNETIGSLGHTGGKK